MAKNGLKNVENMKARMREVKSLLKVSLILNSTLHLEEVVETVIDQAMSVLEAEAGTLWLITEDGGHMEPLLARGPRADALKGMRLKRGEGLAGQVTESGKPVLVSDVRKSKQWASRFDSSTGFETRSLLCVQLKSKNKILGCLQFLNKTKGRKFKENDLRLCKAFASQAAVVIDNSILFTNQRRLFMSFIKTLSSALDARDSYTMGHSARVSEYSLLIGERYGLSKNELDLLEQAALLHDIGKIGVRDNVLLCPGPLSDEAFQQMRTHPVIGARIISQMEPESLITEIREGALHHQEKYDGTGYPGKLSGEDIPLFGRIIAIADTFDAITTDRPYRKGKSFEEAAAEIKRCSGRHFDPVLAEIFVEEIIPELNKAKGLKAM